LYRIGKDGEESRKERKRNQLGKTIKSLEDTKRKQPGALCMINSNYKLESSKVVYEQCCQHRFPWAVCTVSETQTRSPPSRASIFEFRA